jgi:N-acylglucosamine 2-epimerase
MIGGFELAELRDLYKRILLDECIPFWFENGVDHDLGGFYSTVNRDGSLSGTAKRGWQQGRGIYIFARCYNTFRRDPRFLEVSQKGRDFALRFGRDSAGDWVANLSSEGEVIEGPVSIFSDIYMAHGLAELFKADGEQQNLDVALETCRRIQDRITDPQFCHSLGMYTDPHRTNGVWFFFLGALTSLLEVTTNSDLTSYAAYAVDAMINEHLDQETNLFIETLTSDAARFNGHKGVEVMPGHSAEACKTLMDEALRIGNQRLFDQSVEILKSHYEAGWDPEYGGIFFLVDIRDSTPVDDSKNTWQQVEFMGSLMQAYEHTQADWASDYYGQVHRWAFEHHPDKEYGLWHQMADRKGRPQQDSVSRDMYHFPRTFMSNLESLERQIERRLL